MVEPGTITHRTVEFTVEFVNSGAITMGLVNKTVGFIDVLLIEYLKKEMATDSVIEDLDVALYDTETMLNGKRDRFATSCL